MIQHGPGRRPTQGRIRAGTSPKGVLMRNPGWMLLIVATHAGLAARADQPPTFERDVRPIFKAYCLDCHGGGEKLEGNLDLRLGRLAVKGGDGGAAIVPGKPAESLLVERLKAGEMP